MSDHPTPSTAAATADSRHRADIDGLRGLAVLSVLAVHSIPDAVHGGLLCSADGRQTMLLRDGQLHPTAYDEAHPRATASHHVALVMPPQLKSTVARFDGQR